MQEKFFQLKRQVAIDLMKRKECLFHTWKGDVVADKPAQFHLFNLIQILSNPIQSKSKIQYTFFKNQEKNRK